MRGLRLISVIVFASVLFATPVLAAPACGPLQRITALPITPVGKPGNVVTVPALVDKRAVKLLVDTGASFSMINKNIVDELKLPTRQSRVQLVNIAGQRTTQEVRLPSITLGQVRQEGVYFIVDDNPNPIGGNAPPFDGVLGADFLLNVDLDFDFTGGTLSLFSSQHCKGQVVYWTNSPQIAVVPMRVDSSGKLTFPLTLDGHRINAILDTGATRTSLNLDVAKRTFDIDVNAPDVQKTGEVQGGFTANLYQRRFKTLSIEGVTVTDPMVWLLPNMMRLTSEQRPTGSLVRDTDKQLPDALLGMSVLSKLHVYGGTREATIYITAANPGQPVQGAE